MKRFQLLAILWSTMVVGSEIVGAGYEIKKPSFFKTLVNPECSHCVDEAKRRGTEMRANDRVLAWIRGKYDGGAVPFRFFLVPYRVISDSYGVWVYDADAGFVRGFEPSYDFSFHGWRNGIMTIEHKDGTVFSALSGMAVDGPRKGTVLKPLPIIETEWGYWLKAYPKTVAYHMFDKYAAHPLPDALNSDSVGTRPPADRRLSQDERVIGLSVGNQARAYPISTVASNKVIRDTLGGQEIVVLWYGPTRTAAIYAPRMEEGKVPERLKIESNAQLPTAPFMDHETFSHWSIAGRAVEGPLKGKTLVWLPGVECKWFAWAAEYPKTEIYSGSVRKAEAAETMMAKLIQGERLDWDSLIKTPAKLVKKERGAKSVIVFTENDNKEHALLITPQTEFHVEGAWGTLADFDAGQSVYLIASTNKEGATAHALTDELSYQAMTRPYVLKEFKEGMLLFEDEKGRLAPIHLKVNRETKLRGVEPRSLKAGRELYFNSRWSGSERTVTAVMDRATMDQRRMTRLQNQLESVRKEGLRGTILDTDSSNHQMSVLVRRSDSWYARFCKIGDKVGVRTGGGGKVKSTVVEVRPDYSRMRIRLEVPNSGLGEAQPGAAAILFPTLPEKMDFDATPDLGRFAGRQDRIDYFMSTLYCPCGMLGSSCAGHWNTLAACKLHGCGMPNLLTKVIGEKIDAGKSDQVILDDLVRLNGTNVIRIHQN